MKFHFKAIYMMIALSLITVFFLCGCDPRQNFGVYDEKVFSAFNGAPVVVKVFGLKLSEDDVKNTQNYLDDLNAEFSATDSTSAVYAVNSAGENSPVKVSERFFEIFNECAYMNSFTRGKFDISVYPLTLLWQFAPNFPVADFTPPPAEGISNALLSVGQDKFNILGENIVKTVKDAKLDLGGAVKGYAAEKIAKTIKEKGATGGYINCGNSSLFIISADALSIVHPRKDGNIIKITEKLTDLSVSTSGDYERTYFYNGTTYSHIIDPSSGRPANTHIASATVITENGLKADALSTALCLFSHDPKNSDNSELIDFIKNTLKTSDFKKSAFYVVYDDNNYKQIITNKKQGENFTLSDNDYQVVYV